MKVLFAGSPEIAVPALEAVAAAHEVVGVLTNPDAVAGRGRVPVETPVAARARTLLPGVPVLKPESLKSEARGAVGPLGAEVLVVFAYGHIFGPKFLALFPRGGINVHPSLLPKFRGATPIPAAILAREAETGVTVQTLALQTDSGDILAQERIPLSGRETTGSLSLTAAEAGARLAVRVLGGMAAGSLVPVPQDGSAATFCGMIGKEDGLIDWSRSATEIDAQVRAYDPWPGTYTLFNAARLAILAAAVHTPEGPAGGADAPAEPGTVTGLDKEAGILVQTGKGTIAIGRLQLQAKKALDWRSFLNGTHGFIGARLGNQQ